MSGPSFGQRAIALTTSSCHRGVAQGRSRDGSFPSSGEYTAIPFSGYQSAESEIAAEETTWKENTAWTGRGKRRERESGKSASLDNQRLWRRAILLLLLRGVVKDACYERRTDKMTDRNKFSSLPSMDCRPLRRIPRTPCPLVNNSPIHRYCVPLPIF